MDERTLAHLYRRILFSDKNQWAIKSHLDGKFLKHVAKIKKPVWKGYLIYDSTCIIFWKRQNYRDDKQNDVFWGIGAGHWKEDFFIVPCIYSKWYYNGRYMTRMVHSDFLPKITVWKWCKLTIPRWSKLKSIEINHTDSGSPWYDVMRMASYLCDFSPQNTWPYIIMTVKHKNKNKTNPSQRDIAKQSTNTPQKQNRKQGNPEKISQPKEA